MGLKGPCSGKASFQIGAVKGTDILMRSVSLPLNLKGETLWGALRFKAEEELPYAAEESALVMPGSPRGLFFSTRQDLLPQEPYDALTPVPLALLHFASYFNLPESYLLLYSDEEEVLFLFIENRIPRLYTSVSKVNDYEKEILRRVKAYGWGPETPCLLLGERVTGLGEEIHLPSRFGMTSEEIHRRALLIGMCRLVFDKPVENFDLGCKKVSFKKLPLFKPFAFSTLAFLTLWIAGTFWYERQKEALNRRFQTEDIENYIAEMQEKTAKNAYPYPLKPLSATFTDFLAWVNSQAPSGIQIEKVHYSLSNMPTLKAPKERYVTQVDLVFLANSAADARLFHDRLIAPNPFVLVDTHFVWQSSEKDYRTSFRLKDRTVYELS